MYRCLVIALTICLCGGAIVPASESKDEKNRQRLDADHPQKVISPPASQAGNQLQTSYSSAQYYYPGYPEYSGSNGYEGYLVPASFSPQRESHWATEIASSFLPFSSHLLIYGAQAGAYLLHFFFIIILGGAFTTMICTFTPICTINFLGFGIANKQVKDQVAELARTYITPESVNAATILVSQAIDKYTAMQRQKNDGKRQQEGPTETQARSSRNARSLPS